MKTVSEMKIAFQMSQRIGCSLMCGMIRLIRFLETNPIRKVLIKSSLIKLTRPLRTAIIPGIFSTDNSDRNFNIRSACVSGSLMEIDDFVDPASSESPRASCSIC